MGHLERKMREKENTKSRILKAALDIAIAENWQAVTIRRISEAIEYTTSIVYEHFENKEALLREITNFGFQKLYKQSEKVLSEELEPQEQLLKLSLISWDFAQNNKELYQLMFSFEKPTGEFASKGMFNIIELFIKLTGKSKEEVDSIILNWICLRQGTINLTLNFKEDQLSVKPREQYIEFINRFILSITS